VLSLLSLSSVIIYRYLQTKDSGNILF